VHLGRAGVGEAGIHPAREQCSHERFRTVHLDKLPSLLAPGRRGACAPGAWRAGNRDRGYASHPPRETMHRAGLEVAPRAPALPAALARSAGHFALPASCSTSADGTPATPLPGREAPGGHDAARRTARLRELPGRAAQRSNGPAGLAST
jgi:hypothetical protein